MEIQINELESFLLAMLVLFIGRGIISKVPVFQKYNLPEPIVGGLVMAFIITILYFNDIHLTFVMPLRDTLMLMFFSTVGLAASYKLLAKGGAKVFVFLGVASVYIVIQNLVGVSLASAMGLEPLLGLIAGSITLSGGHGTGAAWAQTFRDSYGLETLELAIASATFGLVMGGLIGGPVAQRLIRKHGLESEYGTGVHNHHIEHPELVTYDQLEEDRVTGKRLVETLFIILLCVAGSQAIKYLVNTYELTMLQMPDFVYALFLGVVIANITELRAGGYKINNECVDIIGTVSLAIFLAMALMSLKLWEIFDLALPLLIILLVQTITLAFFATFVTFKIMGKTYDAAVIAGGHCGFGMGATPTAVMNMGALVTRNGPSPTAFMVVPIVGAFFIDIVNLIVLQFFIKFIA